MDEYSRFAFLYDPLITPALRPIHRDVLDLLDTHACSSVIDLCCGTGVLAGMAASAGLDASGVDLSQDMLAVARSKQPGSFLRADATAVPLPNNSFDAAVVSFGLHEKPHSVALGILAEARRLVRPGGLLIVADYRRAEHGEGFWTGRMISLVERMAGREHHAHYRRYMDAGGTGGFLRKAEFMPECIRTRMNGHVGLYLVLLNR